MFTSLSLASHQTIRQYRLTFGLALSVAIAFAFNWPLAYFMPFLVCKFLCGDKATLPASKLIGVLLLVLVSFLFGIQFSRFLLPYPLAFFIVAAMAIYWLAYWSNRGGNEFVVTLLYVSIAVVPMLAQVHAEAAIQFTMGFGYSCTMAVLVTLITFSLFPLPHQQQEQRDKPDSVGNKQESHYLAALTTTIALPAFVFFFLFDMVGGILILTFILILAQKPATILGTKGSIALLIGNILGGAVSLVVFALLVAVPDFGFAVVVYALLGSGFSLVIFSSRKIAPLFTIAITTVIVIIGGSTIDDGGASSTLTVRLIQIALACFYVLFMSHVASNILPYDIKQLKEKFVS